MWLTINDLVSKMANWLELVGFLLAAFTAIKVFFLNKAIKRLNARHLFSVRVEEHLFEFKKTSKKISTHLADFSQNTNDIRIEITKCLGNCSSLKKKVENSELEALKQLIITSKKIKSKKTITTHNFRWLDKLFDKSPLTEADVIKFYETLTLLITEIEQLDKDIKKSLK
jgi:hypothetical protein